MIKRPKDDFDIVLIKKLKIKPILFDKKEGGFDGLFYDQDNNLILVIKKQGNSTEGFGIDLLSKDEGSINWINIILIEMFTLNKTLYSKINTEIAKKINQAISDKKLRRVLIYQRPNTHVFMISELNQKEVWKYIEAFQYESGYFSKYYY